MATYYIPSAAGWQANGGGTYSSYLRIRCDTSYNVSTNQTTVTVSLEAYNNTFGYEWSVLSGGTLTGNGSTLYTFETATAARTHSYSSAADNVFRQIASQSNPNFWSFVVNHADDGSASFTVGVNLRLYHYSPTLYSNFTNLSGTVYLSEPRASDVAASNGYFGDAIPISVTRKSAAFTHTITATCLGRSETIASGSTASSLSWTPSVATYAPLLTNGMSTTATIYCYTYNGATLVGTKTVSIIMSLKAEDIAPSLSLTVVDVVTAPKDSTKTVAEYYGAYVATKSKLRVTTNPTLRYGASVSTTSITANGATYNASPATTDFLISALQTAISGSIVDSRQQTASASGSISILAYDAPRINAFAAHRCQQDGTLDDSGAYCRVDYDISITALNDHNGRALKVGIKKRTESTYAETAVALSAYAESGSVVLTADTEFSFDIRLTLTDDFSSAVVDTQLSSAYAFINFMRGGLGIGIGKVAENQKAVDLARDWELLHDGVPYIYPVGSIYLSVDSTSPATLFGGTWEQLKDCFLLAAGDTYSAGATGGEAEHTLTESELPSMGGYIYPQIASDWGDSGESTYYMPPGNVAQYSTNRPYVLRAGNEIVPRSFTRGGSQAHNNMPPYLAVYVWKRIA